ncbi:MAG TPA: class I SAM-dependent methyltransferase [Patescibacteria group bacterium]|nr:class I SAM-dependent methyltransferase [Patescibacteria group bacterium]
MPLFLKKVKLALKKRKGNFSLDEEINFIFNWEYKLFNLNPSISIKPMQKKKEATLFLEEVKKINPRIICEVGSGRGGMLYLFSRIANKNAQIISIDIPKSYLLKNYLDLKDFLYNNLIKENQTIYPIKADSHKKETLNKLKQILNNKKIDLLFIDGDHSYKGVKKDFQLYSPLVKKNGIIAFHDIVPNKNDKNNNVYKFWKEIKKEKENFKEIIENPRQKGMGIGLIYKK